MQSKIRYRGETHLRNSGDAGTPTLTLMTSSLCENAPAQIG